MILSIVVALLLGTSEWPNFQGTVDVASDGAGLAITVPRGEVTTAGFWTGIAASLIGYAAGTGSGWCASRV